ncbi:MAG: NfeD family protein [Clostridiaceae bacterium]|nr:NfeD family protein [Clostridiaceae bacterium]
MDPKILFWIFVAVVMGVIESATMSLVSIWFCVGAIAAAITAMITDSVLVQCIVFVASTAILLAVTRPVAHKFTKTRFVPTNADRIIGSMGIVTKKIDHIEGQGQINLGGQIWSAKSETSVVIEEGSIVTVKNIIGVHAIVCPTEKEEEK